MGKKARRIYSLIGYDPEVIAVAFAKCSRSPEAFDDIVSELDSDKSRRFHEKWVVGYGHSSVAEHAILSLAVENVSILATKVIEDNRLASFTEKSTRYQMFCRESVFYPKLDNPAAECFKEAVDVLFDTYEESVLALNKHLKGRLAGSSEIDIRNKALDAARSMLPVCVLTNLGMTINARSLSWAIIKMLSHPLEEIREIGSELKEAGLKAAPTLVRHIKRNDCIYETEKSLKALAGQLERMEAGREQAGGKNEVILVEYDPGAELKIAAALIYRHSDCSYRKAEKIAKGLAKEKISELIIEALKRIKDHDRPLRELEHVSYTFDILVDYGSFRDIQRHRISTQTNQRFTPLHGYETPDLIIEAGLDGEYKKAMQKAREAFDRINDSNPDEAPYVLPMAYRKRFLMKMNLRELFHFIRLRSSKMGHISYRRIAWRMHELISEVHPLLSSFISSEKDQ